MAVFTKLEKQEIEDFLKQYSIGTLMSFEGIVEGIENTNYKITTSHHDYILTVFEKRVNPKELPFFMNLQRELVTHGFDCPLPIENNNGTTINSLKDKSAVIISFIEGKQLQYLSLAKFAKLSLCDNLFQIKKQFILLSFSTSHKPLNAYMY